MLITKVSKFDNLS